MTREEAIHIVDVAFSIPQAVRRFGEDRTYHEDEVREAKSMAIEALEQQPCDYYDTDNKTCRRSEVPKEPCEDVISRQAVLNLPRKALKNYFGEVIAEVIYVRDVMELPHVTPQPKMGHWIFKNDNVAIPTGYYQCSECGCGKALEIDNYCPNCGAKMESEG